MKEKKPGVGFGVMLLKNNKILLGKRHEDPEKASSLLKGEGTWTMPGGKLDFQESFEDGAKREVKEETDIDVKKVRVISVSNDRIESAHFITIGFLCEEKYFEGEAKVMEPDEITEWKWFDLNDLPYPLYFPSERVLENFLEKKFYKKRD